MRYCSGWELLLPAFIDASSNAEGPTARHGCDTLLRCLGYTCPRYAPQYDSDGELIAVKPIDPAVPALVENRPGAATPQSLHGGHP